MVTGTSDGSRS